MAAGTPVPEQAKPPTVKRTLITAKVLIESDNLTQAEHDRTVLWVAHQVKDSARFSQKAFVAIGVYDESGNSLGFAGHGTQASTETKEIVSDIFDVA